MKKIILDSGTEMMVLQDDKGISKELEGTGTHEKLCTEFLSSIIKPGMIVYDIGANLGYYVLLETSLVEDGFVYAFEPVPQNFQCLQANIELTQKKNCAALEVAFGNENSLEDMKLAVFSNSASLMKDDNSSEGYKEWFSGWYKESITVEQWRLDDFRKLYNIPVPDMIRMDVEGYEVEILSGAVDTLKEMSSGSILFVEFHPTVFKDKELTMDNLMLFLESLGFSSIWADGYEDFNGDFASWACNFRDEDGRTCPHTFLVKK